MNQKLMLVILDGWGNAPAWGGNAVELAETLNMNNYWRKYPHTVLKAAEEAVGLPLHEPGNSEVGHLNIGCGQIVRQNLSGISQEIAEGSFFRNAILLEAIENARKNSSNLHLIGLVSDGGVHSHINHLFALLELIKSKNFDRVYIHMITDGRDTDPMKALSYLAMLDEKLTELQIGRVESVMGRYYAMDRDNRWDRLKLAYDVLVLGVGPKAESAKKAIADSYRRGQYDEFITPTIIENSQSKFAPIKENDSVIFFNFRADRTRELTWAFVKKNLRTFDRRKFIEPLYFATFAFHEEYEEKLPVQVIFRPSAILTPLAKVLSENNFKQLHVAETEKYAHVTYFFDGTQDKPFSREDWILVPSSKVPTYDLKPEMSAEQVTETVLKKFANYDFIVVNFANADMVGHTGNLKAAVRACEFVDVCLARIVSAAFKEKWVIIVTADHGNAEMMINPNTGEPHTEHTTNPVPFVVISENPAWQSPLVTGSHALSDVSPTILKIMGLGQPKEMTGKSLVE